jgi:SAM-dependent methyltransferase
VVPQGHGAEMARRLRLAKGVTWYPINQSVWVVISPLGQGREKCRLLNESHTAVLDFFRNVPFRQEEAIPSQMRETVESWLSPKWAILEEVKEPRPLKDYECLALDIFEEYRAARGLGCYHDSASYYQHKVQDPLRQFDEIETTVSHLYRESHPALQGKSYGARFAELLFQEGRLTEATSLLEVGCGTGLFGKDFLSEVKRVAPDLYETLHYTYLELSPVLKDCQKLNNREHRKIVSFAEGNALADPIDEKAYDIVISNEVIADLAVIKLSRERRRRKGPEGEAWDLVKKIGLNLSDAPPQFILNIGALKFLSNLSRALKLGGKAYVVEYGSPLSYPVSQFITDHTEYSIHFGHLLRGASAFGLEGTLQPLTEFLRFDADLEVLDNLSHEALFNHLLPFLGIEAHARRVYTRSMLTQSLSEVFQKVQNLAFVPLKSLKGIAYPDGFYVLKLLKQAG